MASKKVAQIVKVDKGNVTMAELLARAPHSVRGFSSGQKVKGRVVAKNAHSLVLDIGGKSEGVVAEKAFTESRDFIKNLKVGDEVLTTVVVGETKDGVTLLSLRHASQDASWEKLEKAKTAKTPIAVLGKGVNPSGVTVEVEGLIGFIPASQLGRESSKNPEGLIGKHLKTVPLEVEKLQNKIILSEKEVTDAVGMREVREAAAKIKEGEIFDGVVTTVANFGCFVKFKVGLPAQAGKTELEGLVHISELSWQKVAVVSDAVSEGEKVKVKVIGFKDGKIALSLKQAQDDPWTKVEKKYKKEAKVKGKVTRISDFGVFVELEPGVEGLIHVTKIPPATKLSEGQEVNCYIEEIDAKSRKISLGLVLSSKPIGYK